MMIQKHKAWMLILAIIAISLGETTSPKNSAIAQMIQPDSTLSQNSRKADALLNFGEMFSYLENYHFPISESNEIRFEKLKIEYGNVEESQFLKQAFLTSSMPTPSTQISFSIGVCQTPPPPPIRRWMCSKF